MGGYEPGEPFPVEPNRSAAATLRGRLVDKPSSEIPLVRELGKVGLRRLKPTAMLTETTKLCRSGGIGNTQGS